VFWTLPRHLRSYEVSGWKPPDQRRDAAWWDGMTMEDRRNIALIRAQEAEDDLIEARAGLVAVDDRLRAAHAETIGVRAQLNAATDSISKAAAETDRHVAERGAILGRALAAENTLARLTDQLPALLAQASQPALKRAEAAERKIDVLLTTRAAQEARVQTLRSACMAIIGSVTTRETEDAALQALARWMAAKRPLIGLLRRPGGQRIAAFRSAADALGVGKFMTAQACASMLRRRVLFGLLRRSGDSAEALIRCMLVQHASGARRDVAEQVAAAVLDARLGASPDGPRGG
jgi:hypothetical protein